MNTWVKRSLNVGVLTAGALLVGGAAAQAGPTMDSTGNIGALTGNQLNLPVQVPVDVCGNAVGILGTAGAACDGGATALNPEWRFDGADMDSTGNIGLLNGNQANVPVQVPVDVCGNAVAVLGAAGATCDGGAHAGPGRSDRDRDRGHGHGHYGHGHDGKRGHKKKYDYERTHTAPEAAPTSSKGWRVERVVDGPDMDSTGNIGLLNGNQLNVPVQVPINICGNAIALLGAATAECDGGAVAH